MAGSPAVSEAACTWDTRARTYVEPNGIACGSGSTKIGAAAFGFTTTANGADLDGDSTAGSGENTDADDGVFATLAAAIECTSTGGIVDIMGPGILKENLTVSKDVTIRGPAGGGAILEPPCTSPGGTGIAVSGAYIVRIENLTIRGYQDHAVSLGGTSGQRVTIASCLLEGNGTGVVNAASGHLVVHDSWITANGANGINHSGSTALTSVSDCRIADNGDDGIILGNEVAWGSVSIMRSRIIDNGGCGIKSLTNIPVAGALALHDSDISDNGEQGIKTSVISGNGTLTVALTDCSIMGNGLEGLYLANTSSRLSLANCRIVQNAGDGIEVSAGLTVDLSQTAILQNGGKAINDTSGSTINCKPGFNVLAGNNGLTNTTTNCTNGSPGQDNQN